MASARLPAGHGGPTNRGGSLPASPPLPAPPSRQLCQAPSRLRFGPSQSVQAARVRPAVSPQRRRGCAIRLAPPSRWGHGRSRPAPCPEVQSLLIGQMPYAALAGIARVSQLRSGTPVGRVRPARVPTPPNKRLEQPARATAGAVARWLPMVADRITIRVRALQLRRIALAGHRPPATLLHWPIRFLEPDHAHPASLSASSTCWISWRSHFPIRL